MTTDLKSKIEHQKTKIRTKQVLYFPVRHHSPACAWHLRETIRREKPTSVLIEGPEDITPLIPFILDAKTKAPFAVYTTYVDKAKHIGTPEGMPDLGPMRVAGYYPFCDYSPELVALREGSAVGARLRFIDLTFPEKVMARSLPPDQSAPRPQALLDEGFFKRSIFLAALAKRTGCRDQDDLWDHLFEANFLQISTKVFLQQVAAYCLMARLDSTPQSLEADGTTAREEAMAAAICGELSTARGMVLVVTGGFHTIALPDLVQEKPIRKERPVIEPENAQTVLMRYSFEQLDALNGYASGMPSPDYYQRFWGQLASKTSDSPLETANRILVEIGRVIREKSSMFTLSTADEIAALGQVQRLARFRGHHGPTREDLMDGIRSCFVKGAMDGEGALLMSVVRKILAGDRIGDLPPNVGVPPIVDDFHQVAQRLKLKISDSSPKTLPLDLYRKTAHRKTSRFLHTLDFLNVPFGRMTSGPDFVKGSHLERLIENWEYRWVPQTESTLIEQSLYGSTVEEAAINRLKLAIAELEEEGKSRSAVEAVRMLVAACRMGLHAFAGRILEVIAENIAEDASFASLVEGLSQLVLLWQSREPLEAHRLPLIPELCLAAYRKACFLIPNLAACPKEQTAPTLESLCAMREFVASEVEQLFDPDLFYQGLATLPTTPQVNPTICGGAVGILYGVGKFTENDLLTLVCGFIDSATGDSSEKVGFLHGLLRACREIAWNLNGFLEAIDRRLNSWDEDDFLHILPELRLSFADMTPRETDKVAEMVAGLHGKQDLGELLHRSLTETDMQMGVRINNLMLESLERDNLSEWAK